MSSSAYQRSVNTFTSQTVHFLSDQFGSCQRLLNTCPSTSGIELFYVKQAAMLSGFTAKRVKILNPSTTYLSLISVANPILDFTSYLHIHQHRQLRRFHNSHSHINWMHTLHLHKDEPYTWVILILRSKPQPYQWQIYKINTYCTQRRKVCICSDED